MRKLFASLIVLCFVFSVSAVYAGSNASSGLTANDFITRLRVDMHSSKTVDTFFEDTDVVQWINEAVEVINGLSKCMEASETIVLSSGTMEYAISATHYDISHVVYDSGVANSPQRFNWVTRLVPGIAIPPQEKRPKFWWEFESKLNVWPVPDSEISGTTIVAYLIPKHVRVSDTTTAISLPSYMDVAVMYYIRAKAHFKEKAEEKAVYYLQLFNSFVNEHKRSTIYRDLTPISEKPKEVVR